MIEQGPAVLDPGEKLVACFRPFLEHLVCSDLSRKTIQKHVDNMWVLGGEIIRDLNQTPPLRRVPVEKLLADLASSGNVCERTDNEQFYLAPPCPFRPTSPKDSVGAR